MILDGLKILVFNCLELKVEEKNNDDEIEDKLKDLDG
jgi:hypothetical protein